jgi:hypothetical protein
MKKKPTARKTAKPRIAKNRPTVGQRIIEGLEQAVAWTQGENARVRGTPVQAPDVSVRDVRQRMGLSQAQFATKFGRVRCSPVPPPTAARA